MALGLLSSAAKLLKGSSKPKGKVDAKKFAGKKEEGGATTKPKASLVQTVQTVKIVDVKPDQQKESNAGPFETLRERTHNMWVEIAKKQKAKKKRAKLKKRIAEKKKRSFKEALKESKIAQIGSSATAKIGSTVGSWWDAIVNTLGILFLGWVLNYKKQIVKWAKKFIGIVESVVKFLAPIVKAIWETMAWIADKGVKLVAMLVGIKPDEALNNSIIKNLTEIQKKFPLIEAAFASFLVFKGLGGIKKIMKPRPRTAGSGRKIRSGGSKLNKARKLTKTRTATTAARSRFARRFGGAAAKKRFGGQVAGRTKPVVSKVLGRGIGRGAKRLGIKALGGRAMKILGKFAKVPIIGPLIVAVTQLLAGEPLGKALFMGVGAGIGGVLGGILAGALGVGTAGFGAVLAPAIMILGEGMGAFVGELLFDGFMGKGWGAAGKKLKDTVMGFLKGTAEIFKSIWKWLREGGLIEVAKTIGKGIMALPGLIANVFKSVAGGIALAGKWIGNGVMRFMDNFLKETAIDIPKGGGRHSAMTLVAKTLGLYDWLDGLGYVNAEGRVSKFPNLLQLMNPFKYVPLLFKSFFPEKAAAAAEKKAAVERGDVAKKNIFGVELSDEHQSEAYLKKRDAGQLKTTDEGTKKSNDLDAFLSRNQGNDVSGAIDHSASYDKVQNNKSAIIPIPIGEMKTDTTGGTGPTPLSSSKVNKYDAVSGLNKTLIMAKLFRG
jgi:hypothetical protein